MLTVFHLHFVWSNMDQIWKSWRRKYYTTQFLTTTRPCCSIAFIESFLFWVILIRYNIGIYICIYIYKVSYIHYFFVICNCNIFSALHAKHFEAWKKFLWNWWVDWFIAQSIKWCDISGVHSESIFHFMEYLFPKKTVFPLVSLSLPYRWVNQPRYFW